MGGQHNNQGNGRHVFQKCPNPVAGAVVNGEIRDFGRDGGTHMIDDSRL